MQSIKLSSYSVLSMCGYVSLVKLSLVVGFQMVSYD